MFKTLGKLSSKYSSPLKCFIRDFLAMCGWKTRMVRVTNSKIEMSIVQWPLAVQATEAAQQEARYQAYIKIREETQVDLQGNHSPAP